MSEDGIYGTRRKASGPRAPPPLRRSEGEPSGGARSSGFTGSCSEIFAIWFADAKCAARAGAASLLDADPSLLFLGLPRAAPPRVVRAAPLPRPCVRAPRQGPAPGPRAWQLSLQSKCKRIGDKLALRLKVRLGSNLTICSFHSIFLQAPPIPCVFMNIRWLPDSWRFIHTRTSQLCRRKRSTFFRRGGNDFTQYSKATSCFMTAGLISK